MSIFKKKKTVELEPVASIQVGNYIIKEWGRSAFPSGKVFNVPRITIENAALTWRVSVESSHSRYALLQTVLHWEEVSPDGSVELSEGARQMIESICLITFFMTSEDFMGENGPDAKFLKDVTKAMKGYSDRKLKAAQKAQTDAEREKADADALNDVKETRIIDK